MRLLSDVLDIPPMSERALPPVLVLISDGAPTDDFSSGLKELMSKPWGRKAVRLAIAIGRGANKDVLQKFIGHPEIAPLEANNSQDLVKYIKWASTVGIKVASALASQVTGSTTKANIPMTPAPLQSVGDVW